MSQDDSSNDPPDETSNSQGEKHLLTQGNLNDFFKIPIEGLESAAPKHKSDVFSQTAQ